MTLETKNSSFWIYWDWIQTKKNLVRTITKLHFHSKFNPFFDNFFGLCCISMRILFHYIFQWWFFWCC
jgi:hypothetical protein